MASVGTNYTSGDWMALEGKEEEFAAAWKAFAEWSTETFQSMGSATLIQQADDPKHFISFGAWADPDTIKQWRSHSEFAARLGAAKDLCSSFKALDYTVAASVGQ